MVSNSRRSAGDDVAEDSDEASLPADMTTHVDYDCKLVMHAKFRRCPFVCMLALCLSRCDRGLQKLLALALPAMNLQLSSRLLGLKLDPFPNPFRPIPRFSDAVRDDILRNKSRSRHVWLMGKPHVDYIILYVVFVRNWNEL